MSQEKDVAACQYLSVNEHFADLYNGFYFRGEAVLKPEELETIAGSHKLLVPQEEKVIGIARHPDIRKQLKKGSRLAVLVEENQDKISYGMVVRLMLQDALDYAGQIRECSRKNKEAHKLQNEDEFLSGLSCADRLIPVMTMVVYFGRKPWDAAKTLHELLDMDGELRWMKNYVPDYQIRVLAVRESEDFSVYKTGVREVFGAVKYSEDKELLKAHLNKNKDRYQRLDRETFEVINILMQNKKAVKILEEECASEKGKGEYDMCKAFDDMYRDGELVGIEKGIEKGIEAMVLDNLEEGIERARIIQKLEKRFSISKDCAQKYYERFAAQ